MRIKLYILIFLISLINSINCFSAVSTGTGYAPISGNIRLADKVALNNAFIDAISNYYKEHNPEMEEKVNKDFIKLITKYRILERGVKQYTVFYTVEVTFDETASLNIATTKSNPQTIVFFIKTDSNISPFKDKLYDITIKHLEDNGFNIKYQTDFIISTDSKSDLDTSLSTFKLLKARYFIYLDLKIEKSKKVNKLITTSSFFTQKDVYPQQKSEAILPKITEQTLIENFTSNLSNIIKNIKSNYIISTKNDVEKVETIIDLVYINFKSFNEVMNVMDYLKSKGFFNTVKVKSFVTGKAEFEISTKSNIEIIKKAIEEQLKNINHDLQIEDNSIYIEFN
ncbi:MAG: hypothetical protein K6348_09190 [Deferribacterales bacterium]